MFLFRDEQRHIKKGASPNILEQRYIEKSVRQKYGNSQSHICMLLDYFLLLCFFVFSQTIPSEMPLIFLYGLTETISDSTESNMPLSDISLKSLISDRPTAQAKFTGTALPICLYRADNGPLNSQSSGKVCIRAYSLTVSGRVSSGWQRSVCFCAGEQVNVRLGSSIDKRRAIPVFPPPNP